MATTKFALKDVDGNIKGLGGVATDVTEYKKIEETHAFLSQIVSQYTNESFFESLARHLAQCLEMSFVCIDRLKGDGLTAQTVAVYHNGAFEDNVVYALKDTPCGEVVGKAVCCFPSSVSQFFPKDEVLKTLNAESYLGVTLWSSTGQAIGLIAVIGEKPLANKVLAESILKIVAGRAAGELERLQAEKELKESEQKLQAIFDVLGVGITITDEQGYIIDCNTASETLLGISKQEHLQRNYADKAWQIIRTDFTPMPSEEFASVIALKNNTSVSNVEMGIVKAGGVITWLLVSATPLAISGYGVVIAYMDITERKATEEQINRLAFYDYLTQLPNRRLLNERLKHAIEVSRRTDKKIAVLMMDLDKFKAVNDTLGHAAGDELLQQVAERVSCRLREVDTVARLGGDEFVILIEDIALYEQVDPIANAIISTLSQPFILRGNHKVTIGASIGIALYPEHGNNMEELIDNADAALYRAKESGRGCFAYFLQ